MMLTLCVVQLLLFIVVAEDVMEEASLVCIRQNAVNFLQLVVTIFSRIQVKQVEEVEKISRS